MTSSLALIACLSMCLFANLGLPSLCHRLHWQLFGPAGPRGRTWGSIWCQFVWCQQGKVLCFSISALTSEAREHLRWGRNSAPVKDVMYGESHAGSFNKSVRTVKYLFSLLPGRAEGKYMFLVWRKYHWLPVLMHPTHWKCQCTFHCPSSEHAAQHCHMPHSSVRVWIIRSYKKNTLKLCDLFMTRS